MDGPVNNQKKIKIICQLVSKIFQQDIILKKFANLRNYITIDGFYTITKNRFEMKQKIKIAEKE